MKCDVCYTTIPLGETRCPNCGMVMRKETQSSLKQETDYTKKETTSKRYSGKPILSPVPSFKFLKIFSIIIPIASLIITLSVFMGLFKDITTNIFSPTHSEITYSEDVYKQYLSNVTSDLENMEFEVDQNSDISLYGENECEIYIYASKNNIDYNINYMFKEADNISTYVEISGSYEGYDSKSFQYLNETDINKLLGYLGFNSTYSTFKDAHNHLETDEDNSSQRYCIVYSDDYEITVHENLEEDYNKTLFSYTISK